MSEDDDEMARRALSIAQAIAHATPGEKAEARRMTEVGAPAFWRQAARLGISPAQEARWMRFTQLVALLTPAGRQTSIHNPGSPLGAVLAQVGFSEQRLARLMAARGPARDVALERAIRMLAGKVTGVNIPDLARAVFWPNDSHRLARSYYQQLDHSLTEEPQND